MDLEIDAKRICQAALADAGPGEDLDEALLRQCKAQYPDQHAEVYSALTQALDVVAERAGQPKHEAVRACGESPGEFVIQVSSTVVSSSAAEDLPADMQAKIREAVPPGQGSASFSSSMVKQIAAGQGNPTRCKQCGHIEPDEFDTCPKCGERRRKGFLGWLFG